ncbi:hypothetical protein ACFCV8_23870 [Streptomyces sp. NPDC056347]|uniref:hypothetical protein n=1 Tax=Streptomyces sp. NPDC056347 TaxID=3345790 RepID=UPI0035DD1232
MARRSPSDSSFVPWSAASLCVHARIAVCASSYWAPAVVCCPSAEGATWGRVTGGQFTFLARNSLSNRPKKGRSSAYAALGHAHNAPAALAPLVLERAELREGDTLDFSVSLTTTTATAPVPVHVPVVIVIAAAGPSGRPRKRAAFLRRATAEPGQELRLAEAHPLRSTARWKLSPAPAPSPPGQRPPPSPSSASGPLPHFQPDRLPQAAAVARRCGPVRAVRNPPKG